MAQVVSALAGSAIDNRTLLLGGLASILIHILGMAFLVWMPSFSAEDNLGPIYTVDLVGMPGPPPPPPSAGDPEAQVKEPTPTEIDETPVESVPEVAPEPEPAELIPIGKKPEPEPVKKEPEKIESVVKIGTPKKSSKKSAVKPDEEIDKELAKTEKKKKPKPAGPKTANNDSKHLQQALARVKQRVDSGVYGMGGGGGGGQGDSRLAQYYTQVWQRVRSNWTLPQEWQESNLVAIVVISIVPSGHITNIKFEKRSGHPSFDQSVIRAVERSNPLPRFPVGMTTSVQEIGIRFKPEG